CRQECLWIEPSPRTFGRYTTCRAGPWPRGRFVMKIAGRTSRTSRRTGDRGKPAAHDPTLQPGLPSPSRATQRPSALIVGPCQDKVFLADTLLVYAEKASTSQSARDSVGRTPFSPKFPYHHAG